MMCPMQNGKHGDTSERFIDDGVDNGGNQEAAKSMNNLNPDGSGNEITARSPRDMKFTIETEMG